MIKRPEDYVQKEVFYQIYDAFLTIDLPWKAKYKSFEVMLWASKLIDHMVITGISLDSLRLISDGGFMKTNRGVVRGHLMGRVRRGELLFGEEKINYSNAFDFFRKNDECILITKKENGTKVDPKTDWSKVYEFNRDDWIFPWRSPGYATKYSDDALNYLKKLKI